ncbi:hypothetical protein cypCar_00034017 [Cyprinus carpio]|nr:hypothetical protein cypCar_00034017 [Cyprinus carpio]
MIHKYFFLCLWIWFSHDTRIAEIHKQVIDMYDSNKIFGDRLQMDSRTGSLIIRNIRTEHSGLYKLQIIKAGVTYKSFSVAVYEDQIDEVVFYTHSVFASCLDCCWVFKKRLRKMIHSASFFCLCLLLSTGVFGDEVKSVSALEGDSVTLNTDVKMQRDDQILWMFGPQESRIAEIHRQNIYIDAINTIFEKRLQMDDQTGSLIIRNIRTEHSGLYKLLIINNRGNSNKRFNVSVYEREERSHLSISIVVIALLLLLLAVVAVKAQEEEILYADTTFCADRVKSTDVIAADQTLYSTVKT